MKDAIRNLLTSELVNEAASQWDASEEPTLLDDVTNMVYEINSSQRHLILRLTHSSHHTEDEIIAELDWLNYLIQQGIPASPPLLSTNHRLTERYAVDGSYFAATAFEFAPGHFVRWDDPQEWNPALIQAFGQIMGRMHHATKGYNPGHLKQKRFHWYEEDTIRNAVDFLPADQKQVADELEELMQQFNCLTPTVDDYGLVHNDLNPTNFHVHDGQLTLFDFDDCAYNWFINDITVAIPFYSNLFSQEGWEIKITEFLRYFFRGYEMENHLDEKWLDYLPICLRLQNTITLVALHQSNVPGSQYHSFYELVLKTYQEGHPLFQFDFHNVW